MTKGRILIVEPDDNIRHMLRIYFSGKGYEIVATATGADGLVAVESGFQPDTMIISNDDSLILGFTDADSKRLCEKFGNNYPIFFLLKNETHRDTRLISIELLTFTTEITLPFDIEELRHRVELIFTAVRRQ